MLSVAKGQTDGQTDGQTVIDIIKHDKAKTLSSVSLLMDRVEMLPLSRRSSLETIKRKQMKSKVEFPS